MTLKEALQNGMAAKQTDKYNREVIVIQPFEDGPYWLHAFTSFPVKCTSPEDAQAQAKLKALIDEEKWEVIR